MRDIAASVVSTRAFFVLSREPTRPPPVRTNHTTIDDPETIVRARFRRNLFPESQIASRRYAVCLCLAVPPKQPD